MARLLTTPEALARLGWNRSSLWRAERSGRIRRADTVGRRPLWKEDEINALRGSHPAPRNGTDPWGVDDNDVELTSIRAELEEMLAGEPQRLEAALPMRLLAMAIRRRLLLREARGDAVSTAEVTAFMQLELRIHHLEQYERDRELESAEFL